MDLDKFFENNVEPDKDIKCSYVLREDPNEDPMASRFCNENATHKTKRVYVKTIALPDTREDGEFYGNNTSQELFLPQDNFYNLGSRAIRVCEEHRMPLLELWYDETE